MSLDKFANDVAVALSIVRRSIKNNTDDRLNIDLSMIAYRLEGALLAIGVEPPAVPAVYRPERRKEAA